MIELVIVRDKTTQESKGSAFVWYATRSMAERAILQFNLRHALPDSSGEQVNHSHALLQFLCLALARC